MISLLPKKISYILFVSLLALVGNVSFAQTPETASAKETTSGSVAKDSLIDFQAKALEEINQLKQKDRQGKPRRFAEDLFEYRQPMSSATDGGISEDYILGTGDRLQLNVYGSATFETPVQVDGKGDLSIPKIGVVKVSGLTLKKAQQAVQRVISGQFSKASVDLQVIKLREIRISILGEVYKPGTYLTPSLSSILNVLGLAGGPNSSGSFRDIRIVRGGMIVDRIDLYPLRGEGLGNLNVALQSGDVVFVPLISSTVLLEGVFRRVTQARSIDRISAIGAPEGRLINLPEVRDLRVSGNTLNPTVTPKEREEPDWLKQWDRYGVIPQMQFELKDGESLTSLIQWAGGVEEAYHSGIYTRRFQDTETQWVSQTLNLTSPTKLKLQDGDIVTALPKRSLEKVSIQVMGHIRIPGPYAPEPGLRVGELIKRNQLLLPTTYMPRADITRTSLNEVSTLINFDINKALAGDPQHNLLLQERDVVRFYSNLDLRPTRFVRLLGPMVRSGTYELLEGMRASDLLFRAGFPFPQANRYRAELARTKVIPGQSAPGSTVIPIALDRLLSTESQSPIDLKDDTINPLLEAEDQISLFDIPSFAYHRTVSIRGQVARPGQYVLENQQMTLSQVIARSGGLTEKAFPEAAVFLRGARADLADPSNLRIPEIFERLNEIKRDPLSGALQSSPIRFGASSLASKRLVLNFPKALKGDVQDDVVLMDGDEIFIPEFTSSAYVIGEVASPYAVYQLGNGKDDRMRIIDAIERAGGYTRNADSSGVRLIRANGEIIDGSSPFGWWTHWTYMAPGDTVIVPPRYSINSSFQQDLLALTSLTQLALIYKVIFP